MKKSIIVSLILSAFLFVGCSSSPKRGSSFANPNYKIHCFGGNCWFLN
ncbi:MAG: hypothetical protein VYD54_15010 [Bdellovibrionota bacterium]|nr:hypothetical protein [Bdellovibrionota bacterium]